jgi:DNA protecting protein DprA
LTSQKTTKVAHALGRGLAAAGVTVVSGLALGIDAAAHRGALAAGGEPLGVLAGGVDVPYPRRNRALHAHVHADGVLVSELPPAHRPQRWSFPARNRIMAALGRLTVVVEAAESSGTLITAEFAAQLGRELGAVPGHVTAQGAAGSNRLLREGAAVIRSPEDALDELLGVGAVAGLYGGDPARARALPRSPATANRSIAPYEASVGALAVERPVEPSTLVAGGADGGTSPPGRPPDPTLREVLDMVEKEHTVAAISRETVWARAARGPPSGGSSRWGWSRARASPATCASWR